MQEVFSLSFRSFIQALKGFKSALKVRKTDIGILPHSENHGILSIWENYRAKAALPLLPFRRVPSSPPDERKEGDAMITYSELIQTGIFIVALIGLCYKIFRDRKK